MLANYDTLGDYAILRTDKFESDKKICLNFYFSLTVSYLYFILTVFIFLDNYMLANYLTLGDYAILRTDKYDSDKKICLNFYFSITVRLCIES